MSLDDEDNIALVYESTTGNQKYNLLSYSFSWDDRYNEKTEKNTGVNNFELSRISDVLIAEQSSNEFLPKELIAKVNFRNLCVGALKPNEETKDNSIECLKTTNDKYFFSLPTVSDYTLVSLDNNCKTITDKSCANYNYLNDYTSTFWLLTATEDEKNNNDFVYNANYSGITSREARNRLTVRPVLFLDNTLIKTGGEGIKSNPYIVK